MYFLIILEQVSSFSHIPEFFSECIKFQLTIKFLLHIDGCKILHKTKYHFQKQKLE